MLLWPAAVSFNTHAGQICSANAGWKWPHLNSLHWTGVRRCSAAWACSTRVAAVLYCCHITAEAAHPNQANDALLLGRNTVAPWNLGCTLCRISLRCCISVLF